MASMEAEQANGTLDTCAICSNSFLLGPQCSCRRSDLIKMLVERAIQNVVQAACMDQWRTQCCVCKMWLQPGHPGQTCDRNGRCALQISQDFEQEAVVDYFTQDANEDAINRANLDVTVTPPDSPPDLPPDSPPLQQRTFEHFVVTPDGGTIVAYLDKRQKEESDPNWQSRKRRRTEDSDKDESDKDDEEFRYRYDGWHGEFVPVHNSE